MPGFGLEMNYEWEQVPVGNAVHAEVAWVPNLNVKTQM